MIKLELDVNEVNEEDGSIIMVDMMLGKQKLNLLKINFQNQPNNLTEAGNLDTR